MISSDEIRSFISLSPIDFPMAKHFTPIALLLTALLTIGCGGPTDTVTSDASHDDHGEHHDDHDHDHDHDHDGHDHDGHEHDTIKADELGLDVDTLPPAGGPPMPATYAEAVEQLAGMVTRITAGLADDDVDSVHDELHDVGNALENVEQLAKKSEQSEDSLAAVDQLFDAFGAIDEKLHGEPGKDYDEVKDDIDAAMKTLQASTE